MFPNARVLSTAEKIILVWGPAFSGGLAMQELVWKVDEPRHEEVLMTERHNWEILPLGRRELGLVRLATPTSSSSDIYSRKVTWRVCNHSTNLAAVEINAHCMPKLVFCKGPGKKNVFLKEIPKLSLCEVTQYFNLKLKTVFNKG